MSLWKIDPAHSDVSFKVKHLVVSTVAGHFDTFDASIESTTDNFSDARIQFEADIASINTKNEQRDGHLKSADFFDASTFPKMSFVSTSVTPVSEHEMKVAGNLTMHGVTREIVFDAIYNGTVAGPGGAKVAGFELRAKVNRFDYGLQWNALTEAGGVMVGNEVKIDISAEFNQPQ
jgi:polyisoprenoid-binding protein YceI